MAGDLGIKEILDLYSSGLHLDESSSKPEALHYDPTEASKLPAVPIPLFDDHLQQEEIFVNFVKAFFRKHGYLPPCPDYVGKERTTAIRRFKAENPSTWPRLERCARMAHIFFKAPVLITLVYSQALIVVASVGHTIKAGELLEYNHSLCSYVINRQDGSALHIPDLQQDWRLTNVPSIPKSFIGQPFSLPLQDPLEDMAGKSGSVPVGVLCVLHDHPTPPLSDDSRTFLSDLADTIADQIQLTWQHAQRAKEEKMRLFMQNLLAKAVVQHSPNQPSHPQEQTSTQSRDPIYDLASRELRSVLESDFACIVDLSAFHPTWTAGDFLRSGSSGSFGWNNADFSDDVDHVDHGKLNLLGWDASPRCTAAGYRAEAVFDSNVTTAAVQEYLKESVKSPNLKFPLDGPLKILLPKDTQAYLAIPLFNGPHPTLLVIVAKQTPFCPYELPDISFNSNVSVVCLGALIQQRVLEADAAKTAFVAMISHELRTPLHGLLSQLELIREYASPSVLLEIGHLLETAECCGLGLKDVLNDVLDFGKMELTADTPKDDVGRTYKTVDLAALAKEILSVSYLRRRQYSSVVQAVSEKFDFSSVQVSIAVEEAANGWWALFDVPGVRRVLTNLTSNALKYTLSGSIALELREIEACETKEGHSLIEFTIKDTGVGMSSEFQDNLFTPFSQENIFNPGAGLGLSISQKIVERMGGAIHVKSKRGVGTTVKISFLVMFTAERPLRSSTYRPLKVDLLSHPAVSPNPPMLLPLIANKLLQRNDELTLTLQQPDVGLFIEKPAKNNQLRVLVVDDNDIGRKILTAVLRKCGVAFEEAVDGKQALEVFRRFQPHLVWTDVNMPIMDGVESAMHMRRIEQEDRLPRSHIVAISGMSPSDLTPFRKKERDDLDEWLVKGQTNLKALTFGLEKLKRDLREIKHEQDNR